MKRRTLFLLLAAALVLVFAGCSMVGTALSDTGRTMQKAGNSVRNW